MGVLVFQARDNTKDMALTGNAAVGMSGTMYAKSAMLSVTGDGLLGLPLVVDRLTLTGNGADASAVAGPAAISGPGLADGSPPNSGGAIGPPLDPNLVDSLLGSAIAGSVFDTEGGISPIKKTMRQY